MFRKSAAMMFMLVMALLITLKHPVLGYCLCLDSYFTGDCVCETASQQTAANGKNTGSPLSHCCSNCITSELTSQSQSLSPSAPCDGCTEHLNVDVGDFVWQASDQLPKDSENPPLLPQALVAQNDQLSTGARHLLRPIRGDPPSEPHYCKNSLPLYLKHSVLRL